MSQLRGGGERSSRSQEGSSRNEARRVPVQFPAPEHLALEEASTADLVREAIDEAKELVKLEIQLAKGEVERDIAQAKSAAVGFAIALAAAVLVLSLLALALVLALGATAGAALGVAGAFVVVGGIAGWVGYARLPKKPMGRLRERLENDMHQLKERIA